MASQTDKKGARVAPESSEKSKKARKKTWLYAGTVAIFVITVVAFVIAPALGGSMGSRNQNPSFGSYDGKPITYSYGSYFASQVEAYNNYLRQQGVADQDFQHYAYQVWRMAFTNAALREAMLSTTRRAGFRVSSKEIDTAISQNPQFQDENGVFSPQKYKTASLSSQISLRDTTRDDLTVRRYYEDISSSAPSTAEAAFVAAMAKHRRSVAFVSFPVNGYTDADIQSWARDNASLFRKIGLSRITITSSQADAQNILKQIKDNKLSFEDAARSHSKDNYADKGGDAGTVYFHQFAADIADRAQAEKIAALKKGELSDIVKLGEKLWAFFRVNSEVHEFDPAQTNALSEVKDYLSTSQRSTLETWAIARAKAFADSSSLGNFASAAQKANLTVKKAGPFIVNTSNPIVTAYGQQIPLFHNPDISHVPELATAASNEAFISEVFSLEKGALSRPLVLGDNVLVLEVTDISEAADSELSMAIFAYPYFYQQGLDTSIRDTFIKSKKFKDNFQATFTKLFMPASSKAPTTATTVAPTPAGQ